MKLWEQCVTKNEWPAYSNQILYAEPAAWEAADLESIDTHEEES